MCFICAQFSPFEPECAYNEVGAVITEVADAPAGPSTPYTINPGDTFLGTLSPAGDRDWVRIDLVAGQAYEIGLYGAGGGGGTLSDPYLRVYDAGGVQRAFDDDGGPGLDSFLSFTASYTGTYYLAAGSYNDLGSGTYTLTVSFPTAPPPDPSDPQTGTLDQMADYLTHGFWGFFGGRDHRWDTSASNEITVNITGLTAAGQQLARWAFEAWEMVADISFREVSIGGRMVFQHSDSGAYANSNYNPANGFINSSVVNISTNWLNTYGTTIDSYSFQTYIHEVGHALGLGHQGPYNNTATYGIDNVFLNDSWQLSVMSYFNQTQNTNVTADYALAVSAMMADIVAIQNIYGAPGASSATAGNTVWGANSNIGGYMGLLFEAILGNGVPASVYGGGPVALTIYDRGGNDTIDLSTTTIGNRLDLRPESFSDINGGIGNLGIARGTIIENAIGGSGNDHITGNDADNVLWGGAGNDTLLGGSGNDTIYGGAGNDSIEGGMGNDELWGGSGNDTIWGGRGNDLIGGGPGHDLLGGGPGNDTIWGGAGNDTVWGGAGHDLIGGGPGDDRLWGGAGNDTIWGGRGNDQLGGGTGDDELWGGAGNDTIWGGPGNDLIGGGAGNDVLWGGAGNDTIYGGAGNDTIEGGTGDDELWGGAGADVFVFRANHGNNALRDFNTGQGDRLHLTSGVLGNARDVGNFASVQGGDTVLDFGSLRIVLHGFTDLQTLQNHIDII